MDRTNSSPRPQAPRAAALVFGFAFVAAIVLEGCGTTRPPMTGDTASLPTIAPTAMTGTATDPNGAMAMTAANEAWNSRPDFTNVDSRTQEAYAYALFRPDVVEWMPCYCGCARMDHRSNLDCYLRRTAPGEQLQFEEHASYCEVCVRTTLMAKRMVSEGKGLREIRLAVDQQFGGNAQGTPTELPPA